MSQSLQSVVAQQHLLKHPFYQAWMRGEISQSQLQDYACQYHLHVSHFPRYISAIHSQCEEPLSRQVLLENLLDEEGMTHGVSHPELWLRFAEGVGVTRTQVVEAQLRPAIQTVKTTFMTLARASFWEGLGALYAYESQVPEIATSKIQGLKEWYGVEEPRALEFFKVHENADVAHRAALEQILQAATPEQQALAERGARLAGQSLWDFLSDIELRIAH